MSKPIVLTGDALTVAELMAIGRGASVALCEHARHRMQESEQWFLASGKDKILSTKISWLTGLTAAEGNTEPIKRFVLSHCAGMGDPLEPAVVRATMAARINVLAKGLSGCRPVCADVFLDMLNQNIVPIVPSRGAVGAAGSAPLSHILRIACGYGGEAWKDGVRCSAADAMAGCTLLSPTEKEALSLINGSTLTVAMAGLVCAYSQRLMSTAEAACALSFEVVRADTECLNVNALAARNQRSAVTVAERLRSELDGSEMVSEGRIPDPFSIRCAPAVLGAAREGLDEISALVSRELNGACDNPLVLGPQRVVEGGNFHGAAVSMAMDRLKVLLTEVAAVSERRIFRMTYGQLSGLPSFLVHGTGTNSGLMLAQYTAASLVSECKVWSHPASVDSIPVAQHQEDHVSMGPIAARGAWQICHALADVLAIELMCGAQGLDFLLHGDGVNEEGQPVQTTPLKAGQGTAQTHASVREVVPRWQEDRVLHPDIDALGRAVRQGVFARRFESM